MRNFILIAAPGAGKGTLAKDLKEEFNYVHISTGDLLREAVSKDDELVKEILEVMKSGELVSDEIVGDVLKTRLQESDCKSGYILDGFPRNIKQAKMYDVIVEELKLDLGIVILLEIDKELLIKRITGRRLCHGCETIYNVFTPELVPKSEDTCDKCGGGLYQRTDDNLEALEIRYNTYLEQTAPLIEYYKNKNCLHTLNSGYGAKETVEQFKELMSNLGDSID